MNVLDTIKLGKDRVATSYRKRHPFWMKTAAMCGVFIVAGVMYKEAPAIHEAIDKAVDEWKKANTPKEKATVVVEAAAETAWPVIKVAVTIGGTLYFIEKSYKEQRVQIVQLAGMVGASQIELKDLRDATKEVVGQKKADQIEEVVGKKQLERINSGDELTEFNDADVNNPDIIDFPTLGAVWRDKYSNTLNGIGQFYYNAKTGNESFYPLSDLIDQFDMHKDGNYIRVGTLAKQWGFMQADLKDTKYPEDLIKIVQVAPGRYKLIPQVRICADPNGSFSEDAVCGDGDWNGMLNPELRA